MSSFFAWHRALRFVQSELFDESSMLRSWRARRGIRVKEASRVAELRPGMIAKVVGHARAREKPLVSPFTGRRCVAYAVVSEELESRRDDAWTVDADIENIPDFD